MNTTTTNLDPNSGAARLIRLESAVGTYQIIAVVALALAIAALGISIWTIGKNRVSSSTFALTGPQGNVLAELGISTEGNPGLFFYDDNRNTRLWMGMENDGAPRLVFGDSDGKPRASIILDNQHQQQARVTLLDANGASRATFGLADNGIPGLEFANDQGQPVYRVPPSAGNTPEERWVNFNTAATRAFVQGQLPQAEKLYMAALKQAQQFGPTDLRRAATLNNLGVLYLKAKQLEQAEKAYNAALKIREKELGKEHPQYGQSLGNLALLRKAQGKTKEAAKLFKTSLAILEKAMGKNDPRLINNLTNYAEVLRGLNKHKDAAALDERVAKLKIILEKQQTAAKAKKQK